jgi:hypothetical protein
LKFEKKRQNSELNKIHNVFRFKNENVKAKEQKKRKEKK